MSEKDNTIQTNFIPRNILCMMLVFELKDYWIISIAGDKEVYASVIIITALLIVHGMWMMSHTNGKTIS